MTPDLERKALDFAIQVADVEDHLRLEVLNQLCGDDVELRAAVQKFRASLEAVTNEDFLGQPASEGMFPSALNSRTHAEDETNPSLDNSSESLEPIRRPKAGRFRPIERLGLGGQGEVWKALDPELDRYVALKVVKRSLQGSLETIAKFRREAEVTGKLEHPNIVPVYEAGHEDVDPSSAAPNATEGSPFYVMRVIGDQNLSDAIKEFHGGEWSESALRKLLGHLIGVCNAMAYAHSRGAIHRDLKPHNVMLGDFGETMVVDWGLAKIVGRDKAHYSAEGVTTVVMGEDNSQTRVGSIKGTPVYMSPEQARGEIDTLRPTSDIYSLGAILFCILTGQPPITARPKAGKRGSESTAATSAGSKPPQLSSSEIIKRVQSGEFPKPTAIEPRTPRALEAICLKAMSPQACDRYARAKDFADDIQRWLDDDAVSAWQEPVTVQAKRWVRQHQTLVTTAAAMLLVAIVSLSVISDRQLAISRETEKGLAGLKVAVDSLESQTQLVDEEWLLRQPQSATFRLRILQRALALFQKEPIRDMNSRELVRRVATQLLSVAETMEETVTTIGLREANVDLEMSESAVKQAQELLATYLKSHRDDVELELLLASAGLRRAEILSKRDDLAQSSAQCVASQALCDQLLSRRSSMSREQTAKVVIERSRLIRVSAKLLFGRAMSASNPDDRRRHLTAALELLAALKQSWETWHSEDVSTELEYAKVLNAIALSMHKGGQLSEEARRAGSFSPPPSALPGFEYLSEVIEIYQQAITACQTMRARLPDPNGFSTKRVELDRLEAQILNNMTLSVRAIARPKGDWETPLKLHERSRELRQGVLDQRPWLLGVRMELAQSLGNIADTLSDSGDPAREMEARRSAINLLRVAITEFPSATGIRQFWALHMIRLMTAYHGLQDDDQATQIFEETIRLHATPEDAEPTNLGHLLDTAVGWALLAQSDAGRSAELLDRAETLILQCKAIGGLNRELLGKLQNDSVFAALRERPVIQELIRSACSQD